MTSRPADPTLGLSRRLEHLGEALERKHRDDARPAPQDWELEDTRPGGETMRRRGRPKGSSGTCSGTCSACGERGHYASDAGLCSRSYLAALMVIDASCTMAEAAKALGVTRQTVNTTLRRLRKG